MLPLRDNIPTGAYAVRHVRADRGQRPRLLLLAARRDHARRPEHAALHLPAAGLGGDPVRDHPPRRSGADRAPAAAPPTRRPYLTPFTAMFMHGGLLHLGGNMLFLWIFGNNVEDAMGPVKFMVFYLLAGVAALALQVVIDPNSRGPDARRLGRDRGRARRLHPAVPAGPGRDGDLHRLLLHDPRAAGAARARASGSCSRRCSATSTSAAVRRRRRVLRAHRRLRLRAGRGPAVREPQARRRTSSRPVRAALMMRPASSSLLVAAG